MLGRVFVIALNTYRESVRDYILLGLAGIAGVVSLYSLVVGAFTLNDAPRVVSDLGSASISIFAVLVAVILSATSLHRELERKTIFPILARPITRGEYIVGKYFGTLLTLLVFVMADAGLVLMLAGGLGGRSAVKVVAVGLALVVLLVGAVWRSPSARTYAAIPWAVAMLVAGVVIAGVAPDERRVVLGGALLSFAEVAIVAAIATFFASFSTPFISALLTLGVWGVGRSADSLGRMPAKYVGQAIRQAGAVLSKVVPNLQIYVPPRTLLTGEAPGVDLGAYLALSSFKAACWGVFLLAFASVIFRRRDFL